MSLHQLTRERFSNQICVPCVILKIICETVFKSVAVLFTQARKNTLIKPACADPILLCIDSDDVPTTTAIDRDF